MSSDDQRSITVTRSIVVDRVAPGISRAVGDERVVWNTQPQLLLALGDTADTSDTLRVTSNEEVIVDRTLTSAEVTNKQVTVIITNFADLAEGEFTVDVQLTDAQQNTSQLSVTLEKDISEPTMTFATGVVATSASFNTVTISIEDVDVSDGTVTFTVTVDGGSTMYADTYDLEGVSGANTDYTIEYRAEDVAGNVNMLSRTVSVDRRIGSDAPNVDDVTFGNTIVVRGTRLDIHETIQLRSSETNVGSVAYDSNNWTITYVATTAPSVTQETPLVVHRSRGQETRDHNISTILVVRSVDTTLTDTSEFRFIGYDTDGDTFRYGYTEGEELPINYVGDEPVQTRVRFQYDDATGDLVVDTNNAPTYTLTAGQYIVEKNVTLTLPTPSVVPTGTAIDPGSDVIGVAMNGVLLFNQWNGSSSALDATGTSADARGVYAQLVSQLTPSDNATYSPLLGFALDGYPIYGPVGTTDLTDPTTGIRVLSSADLDESNAIFSATPEFPDGVYHYVAAVETGVSAFVEQVEMPTVADTVAVTVTGTRTSSGYYSYSYSIATSGATALLRTKTYTFTRSANVATTSITARFALSTGETEDLTFDGNVLTMANTDIPASAVRIEFLYYGQIAFINVDTSVEGTGVSAPTLRVFPPAPASARGTTTSCVVSYVPASGDEVTLRDVACNVSTDGLTLTLPTDADVENMTGSSPLLRTVHFPSTTTMARAVLPSIDYEPLPFAVNGYYPLYRTETEANAHASGSGTAHTHEFGGVTYYMPNGLPTDEQFHGTFIGPFAVDRYYPLYATSVAAGGDAHTHELGGSIYYMPNGLTADEQFHGTWTADRWLWLQRAGPVVAHPYLVAKIRTDGDTFAALQEARVQNRALLPKKIALRFERPLATSQRMLVDDFDLRTVAAAQQWWNANETDLRTIVHLDTGVNWSDVSIQSVTPTSIDISINSETPDEMRLTLGDESELDVQEPQPSGTVTIAAAQVQGEQVFYVHGGSGNVISATIETNYVTDTSYQWLRDDADIDGATSTTYTLTEVDIGTSISVRVTLVGVQVTIPTQSSPIPVVSADIYDVNIQPQPRIHPLGEEVPAPLTLVLDVLNLGAGLWVQDTVSNFVTSTAEGTYETDVTVTNGPDTIDVTVTVHVAKPLVVTVDDFGTTITDGLVPPFSAVGNHDSIFPVTFTVVQYRDRGRGQVTGGDLAGLITSGRKSAAVRVTYTATDSIGQTRTIADVDVTVLDDNVTSASDAATIRAAIRNAMEDARSLATTGKTRAAKNALSRVLRDLEQTSVALETDPITLEKMYGSVIGKQRRQPRDSNTSLTIELLDEFSTASLGVNTLLVMGRGDTSQRKLRDRDMTIVRNNDDTTTITIGGTTTTRQDDELFLSPADENGVKDILRVGTVTNLGTISPPTLVRSKLHVLDDGEIVFSGTGEAEGNQITVTYGVVGSTGTTTATTTVGPGPDFTWSVTISNLATVGEYTATATQTEILEAGDEVTSEPTDSVTFHVVSLTLLPTSIVTTSGNFQSAAGLAYIPPGASLQWHKNATVVADQTSTRLTVTDITHENMADKAGIYKLVLTTSESETLETEFLLGVVKLPVTLDVGGGETKTVLGAVPTTDGVSLSVQWARDGTAVDGATQPSLEIAESGMYSITATFTHNGSTASATSEDMVVTVGSLGDPYVTPQFGACSVKLPDTRACYRLFERGSLTINARVDQLAAGHEELVRTYVAGRLPPSQRAIVGGFFYTHFFLRDGDDTRLEIDVSQYGHFSFRHTGAVVYAGAVRTRQTSSVCPGDTRTSHMFHVAGRVVRVDCYDNPQIHSGIGITISRDDERLARGLLVHGARPRVYRVRGLRHTRALMGCRSFERSRRKQVPKHRRVELPQELWSLV